MIAISVPTSRECIHGFVLLFACLASYHASKGPVCVVGAHGIAPWILPVDDAHPLLLPILQLHGSEKDARIHAVELEGRAFLTAPSFVCSADFLVCFLLEQSLPYDTNIFSGKHPIGLWVYPLVSIGSEIMAALETSHTERGTRPLPPSAALRFRYDPPWTLPFLRTNELWFPLPLSRTEAAAKLPSSP